MIEKISKIEETHLSAHKMMRKIRRILWEQGFSERQINVALARLVDLVSTEVLFHLEIATMEEDGVEFTQISAVRKDERGGVTLIGKE